MQKHRPSPDEFGFGRQSREVVKNLTCKCGAEIITDGKLTCPRCHQSVNMASSQDVVVDEQGRWKCQKCQERGKKPRTLAVGDKIKCRRCDTENSLIQKEEKMETERRMAVYTLHKEKKEFRIICAVLAYSPQEATSLLGGEYIEPEGGIKTCSTDRDELNFVGYVRFPVAIFRPMDETDRALAGLFGGSYCYTRGPLALLSNGEDVILAMRRSFVLIPEYVRYP